jgi:N-acetyl-1-D-myo-inositol-2-amino-2-deoxy-alpha-D-glucopyranoside deacetylase
VFDAAVAAAVEVIREVRPQVVVTYDDNGDYGHPDHIMAHRVATAAVERAGEADYGTGPAWSVAKLYWTATPKSMLQAGFDALTAAGEAAPFGVADIDELPFGVDDAVITTIVDGTGYGAQKFAALEAHRTQITVESPFFALSNMLGREVLSVEHFRLQRGELGPERDDAGRETDLFSGLPDETPTGRA